MLFLYQEKYMEVHKNDYKRKMKEQGNGIYTIFISRQFMQEIYGMMGYTKYTKFNLILTNNDIYSQKYEIASMINLLKQRYWINLKRLNQ